MNILIKNATIISDGEFLNSPKDILIYDKIIQNIGENLSPISENTKIIDASNLLVLPGFIDLNCKISEAGFENKDSVNFISKAASKSGFTTIVTSSSTNPIVDNKTVVEYILSKVNYKSKPSQFINILPFANFTKGGLGKDVAELGEMILAGAAAISDGGKNIEDSSLLRDIFIYSKMINTTVVTSSISSNLAKNGVANSGYMSTKLGLTGISREAEEVEISKNLVLAKCTGARLHISCISTKGAVNLIRYAKQNGTNVTCGTSTQYFSLTEDAIDNYNTLCKVMPPLRTKEDIDAIIEGLKDGTIDCISSGHLPSIIENKITTFESASFGFSGLEVCFPISNTNLVKQNGMSIQMLSKLLSENPAKILNFKNKGRIEKGFDADITIINPHEKIVIEPSKFYSRAKYSPFENYQCFGQVEKTIVSGNLLFDIHNS